MDVDAGNVSGPSNAGNPPPYQGQGGFTPLSDSKKANLITKKACFKCKKPGHISRWCGKPKPVYTVGRQNTAREGLAPEVVPAPNLTEADKEELFEN